MTNWIDFLRHPRTIDALYDRPPSLDGFGLTEFSWETDTDRCVLRGSLAQFPDHPLPRWEDDANRAAIRLLLDKIEEFCLTGWSFDNIVDVIVVRRQSDSKLEVMATGDEVSFRAVCTAIDVLEVFAYHDAESG